MNLHDITGQPIQVGDFLIYTDGGVNAPDLRFGWVRRMNVATDKLWIEHATYDRQQAMKSKYDHSIGKWVDSAEPRGTSIVNHTQDARFMVL